MIGIVIQPGAPKLTPTAERAAEALRRLAEMIENGEAEVLFLSMQHRPGSLKVEYHVPTTHDRDRGA